MTEETIIRAATVVDQRTREADSKVGEQRMARPQMTQSNRTVLFQAHALEKAYREVVTLRRELTEAMRVNAELTAQAKAYEVENCCLHRAAQLMIAAGTNADIRRKLQAVFDAAMGSK